MGIHDGHRERKKEQFRKRGLDGFADHEVLELLLYYAIPRRDINELVHELMNRFGSLEDVFAAPIEQLEQINGVGKNAATLLHLVPELWDRMQQQKNADIRILDSVDKCGEYFLQLLAGKRNEMLYALCVDGKGKLIGCKQVTEGSVNMASISVRQVVQIVIACNASAVVLAHNHPSGVALPSAADQQVTRQLKEALSFIGVELLDHIIVADGDYVSMAASGMML